MKKKEVLMIILSIATIALVIIGIVTGKAPKSKIEVYTDIGKYEETLACEDANEKWSKWGMDESIWPEKITDSMNVVDYKMVYYDPFDAQYLGYLVVEYNKENYEKEVKRLKEYESTDYIGYYGVREEITYDLLAVYADPYYGFVYALTDGKNKIIYAEQIFCNYFMDLNYKEYMKEDYFLDGFNATPDNDYRKKKMKENN